VRIKTITKRQKDRQTEPNRQTE